MYVGRIVAIGRNKAGKVAAMYRVSSRSFPNRTAKIGDTGISIVPREGHEGDVFKNPYIAYNCVKVVGDIAIATNGSHTDPIAEKVASGMSIRDAMVMSLIALDYEKDDYNTPRIASAVRAGGDTGFLGVVRHDGLNVHELPLEPNSCFYLATYEISDVMPDQTDTFDIDSPDAAAQYVIDGGKFADLERPITSAVAFQDGDGFAFATSEVELQNG